MRRRMPRRQLQHGQHGQRGSRAKPANPPEERAKRRDRASQPAGRPAGTSPRSAKTRGAHPRPAAARERRERSPSSADESAGGARHSERSLIDWREPARNAHVLDWRERAHEFGLVPIDESDEPGTSVEQPPGRLLEEEEPEAFRREPVGEDEYDQAAGEADESPDMSHEDLDLMRVYLRNVGTRRLLKASEEQAIGRRIEVARSELQAAFAEVPCALRTLLGLAERVKRGGAPAAELILLPDGGELNAQNVAPVLDAFDQIARELQGVDRWRRKCDDPRATLA